MPRRERRLRAGGVRRRREDQPLAAPRVAALAQERTCCSRVDLMLDDELHPLWASGNARVAAGASLVLPGSPAAGPLGDTRPAARGKLAGVLLVSGRGGLPAARLAVSAEGDRRAA